MQELSIFIQANRTRNRKSTKSRSGKDQTNKLKCKKGAVLGLRQANLVIYSSCSMNNSQIQESDVQTTGNDSLSAMNILVSCGDTDLGD